MYHFIFVKHSLLSYRFITIRPKPKGNVQLSCWCFVFYGSITFEGD